MHVRLGINIGEGVLLFEDLPPLILVDLTVWNWRTQPVCQPFDSRYQRFYRSATRHCLLG